MIRIDGTRFGDIEVEKESVIRFPHGLIGFPDEMEFVLLERGDGRSVAYLQSLTTPRLAFPVTDGEVFGDNYPDPSATKLAALAGIPCEDPAVLVIVAANQEKRLEANLLAPIIIDVDTRRGCQCVLDPRKFSAATSLADPIAEAKARVAAIKDKLKQARSTTEVTPDLAKGLAAAVG